MSTLNDFRAQAAKLVAHMTTSEKAGMVSGFSMWETRAVERLGLNKVDMSDGPQGIRKQLDYYDIAVDESVKTVCFPTECCAASSWDADLLYEMGAALGKTAKLHDISLLLGPGVNIKRSPLCGRNFEYMSEDPYLSGELGMAYIHGVQSEGVSACVKHFAGNNQETRRLTVDAVIDERALREIYLPAFETCVKEAGVDTVMAAYNTLNGATCTENSRLLTEILREEWGFGGMVVSDWGAVTNDPGAAAAGTDLKMPGFEKDPERMIKALEEGIITEDALDKAAVSVTAFVLKSQAGKARTDWGSGTEDFEANHMLARKIAAESMVLLKNDGILPVNKDKKLLIVGEFAETPHFQGGGSSHVNAYKIDSTVEFFEENGYNCTYIPDFADKDVILRAAETCDSALVFAGTPESEESEGFDRTHMDLPQAQNEMIASLCGKIPTAAVLFEGSAVAMPWAGNVSAILCAYLPGEAGGAAVFDVLTGAVNPCGKLAESFPQRREDSSAYLSFPGINDTCVYGESIFTGYRYYDKKKVKTLFPFGHGLSYTSFDYDAAVTGKEHYLDNETVTVTVNVTNSGAVTGKETVQLYVSPLNPKIIRPVKELKAFAKIELAPGETKTVTFALGFRDFAWYDVDAGNWRVETGGYRLRIGSSSADIRTEKEICVESTLKENIVFTRDTLMGEIWEIAEGKAFLTDILARIKASGKAGDKEGDDAAYLKMVLAMPVKALILIGMPAGQVDGLLETLNGGD
jgi:beta-glucosidase